MSKFLSLSFLVFLTFSQALGDGGAAFLESINRGDHAGRIIQGLPAAPNQFPHQVNLEMVTNGGQRQRCGGSLISPRWVLTAAHCVIGMSEIFVRLGSVNFNTPQVLIDTKTFVYHQNYNPNLLHNDVALVDLGRNVATSSSIKVIRLPRRSQASDSFAGRQSTVSGWGYTNNNGPVSTTLNYLSMNVITNDRCRQDFLSELIIASTLCASGISSPSQGTCFGDSGGPLIMRESDGQDTLVGVVSFVSSTGCDAKFASGFARVTSFLDWISQRTGIVIQA